MPTSLLVAANEAAAAKTPRPPPLEPQPQAPPLASASTEAEAETSKLWPSAPSQAVAPPVPLRAEIGGLGAPQSLRKSSETSLGAWLERALGRGAPLSSTGACLTLAGAIASSDPDLAVGDPEDGTELGVSKERGEDLGGEPEEGAACRTSVPFALSAASSATTSAAPPPAGLSGALATLLGLESAPCLPLPEGLLAALSTGDATRPWAAVARVSSPELAEPFGLVGAAPGLATASSAAAVAWPRSVGLGDLL
mmetsp:Transcript_92990/g.206884  ORF Transcript_92990/g.206884 Transcript_92990/m.206884 type:complete len:253 (-) Transcript_92990:839-1597(-)